jgi:predicted dehydrogenase
VPSPPDAPFRIGIVGCGSIAERHARAAAASPEVAIVACADARLDTAEDWAARHRCERAYPDYVEMVRGHELDGVLLATWPNLHREQVLGCLDLEIWTAATRAGALVMEGYMYRRHPAIAILDELLASGELGPLDSIHAAFSLFDPEESAPDDPARDWRQRVETGGGAPFDLACYCLDACNRFAGSRPRRVQALTSRSERYGTIARVFALVEFENGVVGTIESSIHGDFNHELRLSGTRGQARLPVAWRIDHPTEVVASRSVGWGLTEERRFPVAVVDAYRLELEGFAAAARGTDPPVPTLGESVTTALTMDALLTSAAEGIAVDPAPPAELVS